VQGIGGMPDRELSGEVSARGLIILPPAVDGEYYLRLRVKDEASREDRAETYFVVENGQARIPDYSREHTAWVEQAIIYGVIPGKFGRPAFRAITERLPYLADLGINTLWLAPVNVSPADDYGYAIMDYFNLNRAYGSKEEFHRMVQEAHALGIRVLMDFVPNHSSAQHPYYKDTLQRGKESEYYNFYHRDESGAVTHYFDWTHLPNLNYDNPEVVNMMLEAFSYWVREFDVDGFRVDVAWGIRERNPEFWPRWRQELKRIKPDLLLLAEASARDPYYFDNGFDAAYDWTEQLGTWAWELVWDSYKHRLLAYNLHAALTNRPQGYHPDALIFRFLNNNDTGQRFITRQGEGMARISTVMLLTLPGIPCIYTGDELGAEFHPYQNPEALSWIEQFPGLRDFHKQLLALRKAIPALRSRDWEAMEVEPVRQDVYAYFRPAEQPDQAVAVVINFFEEPTELKVHLPEQFLESLSGGELLDLLNGERLPARPPGPVDVPMGPLSARVLAARNLLESPA
jgi:glycosidase